MIRPTNLRHHTYHDANYLAYIGALECNSKYNTPEKGVIEYALTSIWKPRKAKDGARNWEQSKFVTDSNRYSFDDWYFWFMCPHEVRPHKLGGGFCQGLFFSNDNRSNKNMHYTTIISFDVDEGLGFDECTKRFPYHAVIYTTYSHMLQKGSNGPRDRFRVVCPLDEPYDFVAIESEHDVDACEVWKQLYRLSAEELKLPFDPACTDPARIMYAPACPEEMKDHARSVHLEGKPLVSWRKHLPEALAIAREKQRVADERRDQWLAQQADMNDDDIEAELEHAKAALEFIPADIDYPEWFKVIVAFHSCFAGSGSERAALQALDKWSAKSSIKYDGFEPIRKIWDAAYADGGITMGTFYAMARQHGYGNGAEHERALEENAKEMAKLKEMLK